MMTEAFVNINLNKHLKKKAILNNNLIKSRSSTYIFQTINNNNTTNKNNNNIYNVNTNISKNKSNSMRKNRSLVIGQKLRESKWFDYNEISIFCAVVESGFIIEQKEPNIKNNNINLNKFGVILWTPGFEKSKNPKYISVHTLKQIKGKNKIVKMKLFEFWPETTLLRINNTNDKNETFLKEELIRNQIRCAEYSKRKWHNTEHFTYFCRYGPVEKNFKVRKITDQIRWNANQLLLKIRSLSHNQK